MMPRLLRFFAKSREDQERALRYNFKKLWHRFLPQIPLPTRLPFGAWWLAANDLAGDSIFSRQFEVGEQRLMRRLLQPGMCVLDIGAHHGFYSLLASRLVGPQGRVVAFEPSPREREHLRRHLWLNRCENVDVEPVALGAARSRATLHVMPAFLSGCNTLRMEPGGDPAEVLEVEVLPLDEYLERHAISRVDFMKMDVEGAELHVLRGASALLRDAHRPTILAEVEESRCAPWGHTGREVIELLAERGYRWFGVDARGALRAVPPGQATFDANYLAIPEERLGAAR
jgi:FkbM family methyltransferase